MVTHCFPLVNAAESPRTRFVSSPESTFAAHRRMLELGLDALAVYHSHPDGHITPSRTDLEWSYGGGVANVIVAPAGIGVWWYDGLSFEPAAWRVV